MASDKHAVAAYLLTQLDGAEVTTPHLANDKPAARRFPSYIAAAPHLPNTKAAAPRFPNSLAEGEVLAPHLLDDDDDLAPRLPNHLAGGEVLAPHLLCDDDFAPRLPNNLAGGEVLAHHLLDDDDVAPRLRNYDGGEVLAHHLLDDDDVAPRLRNYIAGAEVLAPYLLNDDEFALPLANYFAGDEILAPHLLDDDDVAPDLPNDLAGGEVLAPHLFDDKYVAPLLSADLGRDAAIYLLTELLREILVRLPVVDIVRCQIVEKRWQNIVRASSFGHEYALRRSQKPMFFYRRDVEPEPELAPCTPAIELQELDLVACKTRLITGFSHVVPRPEDLEWESPFTIEGSCDGLLLISVGPRLYVCNPSIRRWDCLAPVHVNHGIIAFYSYSAPGEVGVQYWILHRKRSCDTMAYSIFSLNSDGVRQVASSSHLGASLQQELDVLWSENGLRSYEDPLLRLGDKLYWRPQVEDKSKIIVYDTGAEAFSWIHAPRGNRGGHLLTIDGNVAMAATDVQDYGEIDVWVPKNKWTLCYKVLLPQQEIDMRYSLVDPFGNTPVSVIHLQSGIHVLVQCLYHILQCKHNADVLQRYSSPGQDAMPLLTHHTFCESIAGLPFLTLHDDDVDKGEEHPILFC